MHNLKFAICQTWLTVALGLGAACAPVAAAPPVGEYATTFPLTENPISEGGVWLNGRTDGVDWYNVLTNGTIGYAYGEVTTGEYTDPTAILKGTWAADQGAEGVVYVQNPPTNCWPEVEIRLRSTITAHRITGYEIYWGVRTDQAYVTIVRWNGALSNFTTLKELNGTQYGAKNGDVVKATIVGNVIKGYQNGVEVISVTDNTFATGNPGMGFDYGCGTRNVDFGFTSFQAYDLKAAVPVIAPNGGSFTDSVRVTLTTTTSGAEIRYSTDGSTPAAASPLYSSPFKLTASALVKAIAVKGGLTNSDIASAVFTKVPSANLALNKPVTASSVDTTAHAATLAVDGNAGTRWSSAYSDTQWICIDLGSVYDITMVVLEWETAYGKSYTIQVSDNGSSWTTVYTQANGTGGTETISLNGTGRYIRLYGTARGTAWGYSLYEFEVYGTGASTLVWETRPGTQDDGRIIIGCKVGRITFFRDQPGCWSLKIFNLEGEALGEYSGAPHQQSLEWDFKDPSGKRPRPGAYFYDLKSGHGQYRGKFLLF
jgi:hypothetical protein